MSELFANFEVNREARWPIISKLLVGSVGLHLLLLSCVVFIPGVRQAFNLASLIADTSFVDKDYERTQIGDDVQLVGLSREKFRYPDGYFAPEGQTAVMPPLPPITTPSFIAQAAPPVVQPELGPSPSPSPAVTASATPISSASPFADYCGIKTKFESDSKSRDDSG